MASGIVDKRVLATAMAILLVLILVAAAWQLVFVLMLTFAAVLLAVLLRHTASLLAARTPLAIGPVMTLVILGSVCGISAFIYYIGPRLMAEGAIVAKVLPDAWAEVKAALRTTGWGSYLLDHAAVGDGGSDLNLVGMLEGTVSTTLGIAINLVVVVTVGIYLALDPRLYTSGVRQLLPKRHREQGGQVLDALGDGLWSWMLGQFIDMLIVGLLIGGGLWLLDVPLFIALGVIAGITHFIPYVGPFLGSAPAVVIAFAHDPVLALWTSVLFLVVQQLNSHVFMPNIQRHVTSMPPVLTILVVVDGVV